MIGKKFYEYPVLKNWLKHQLSMIKKIPFYNKMLGNQPKTTRNSSSPEIQIKTI
jgi:hypothetical protein